VSACRKSGSVDQEVAGGDAGCVDQGDCEASILGVRIPQERSGL
jgi:hypothetical protein